MIKGFSSASRFAVVCVLLMPLPAQAGIWRYIEELSGPGPFFGATVEFRALCWQNEEVYAGAAARDQPEPEGRSHIAGRSLAALVGLKTQCLRNAQAGTYPHISLNFESGYLQAKPANNPILYDDGQPRRVHLVPIEAIVYWQPVLGLEVGVGAGMFVFSTSAGSFVAPVIEPMRVDIRPFDAFLPKRKDRMTGFGWRVARSITFRQSFVMFPREMDAADFGGGAGNTFSERGEIIKSFEFVIDFAPLFRKVAN